MNGEAGNFRKPPPSSPVVRPLESTKTNIANRNADLLRPSLPCPRQFPQIPVDAESIVSDAAPFFPPRTGWAGLERNHRSDKLEVRPAGGALLRLPAETMPVTAGQQAPWIWMK